MHFQQIHTIFWNFSISEHHSLLVHTVLADSNWQLNLKIFFLFCPKRPEAGEEGTSQWRLDSALSSMRENSAGALF